tara:strand:- start:17000 stop:19321 length:2322 start_codon:yes stop_codon:yes gene_type:complete
MDIKLPDGTIVRNVPEGITKAQLMARVAKHPSYGHAYDSGDLIADKATFGFAPKVAAGVSALGSSIGDIARGKAPAIGQHYSGTLNRLDAARTKYVEQNPGMDWATLPANFIGTLGAVPEMIAAKVGGGIARKGAAIGATYGAVSGAGHSRGSAGEQVGQIGSSTMFGAAGGAAAAKVVPAAIDLGQRASAFTIRKLGQLVGKYPSAAETAISEGVQNAPDAAPKIGRIIAKTLASQGMTARGAGKMIGDARAKGVPLALMDTGDEMRGLASGLARKPGASRTIMRDAVIPRQEAQTERVQGAIIRDLGPTANVRQVSEDMMKGAKTSASPLYDEAYAAPPIASPTLETLLATPAGKQALMRARTIAADERRDPKAMGFALDADGNVMLNPVNADLHSAAATARSSYDDAVAAAQAAHDASLVALQRQMRLAQGGAARGHAVRDAQAAVTRSADALGTAKASSGAIEDTAAAISAQPTPGVASQVRAYSPQTLDYVKRGLDDVVESHRDPVTGRLHLDEAGRAINDVRANFVKELRDLNKPYGDALNAYAGPARMQTALAKGSKIGNKDHETVWAETRDLPGPELEQYKLGVRSALSKALEGKVDGADKVRALIGTPKKRAVLNSLFGGSDGFDNFMATLAHEASGAATYGRINAGSQTAANLADDGAVDGLGGVVANAGGRALRGHGIISNTLQTVADLGRYGSGKSAERLRSQLASGLSETDPIVLAKLVRQAAQVNAIKRLRTAKSKKLAPKASARASVITSLGLAPDGD